MWHQQDGKIRSSRDFPLKIYWFSNNTWANSFIPNPESSWEVNQPWWAQNQLHSSWWEKFWPLLTVIHQPGTAPHNREETPISHLLPGERERELDHMSNDLFSTIDYNVNCRPSMYDLLCGGNLFLFLFC